MRLKSIIPLAIVIAGSFYNSASAVLVTLTPADTLVVNFTIPAAPTTIIPDWFYFSFKPFTQNANLVTQATKLFDGSTLLGTQLSLATNGNSTVEASWISATSILALTPPPTVVDFSTFVNASINGRIEFNLPGGSLTFDSSTLFVNLYKATSANGNSISEFRYTPIINSFQVISAAVPEVSSFLALGVTTLLGFAVKMRRSIFG